MTKNDGLGDAAKGAAAGAGVGAACWAAVVPAVNFLGFTATGIASDSTAAGIMSAAAVPNGGGVAAGSTVAVLQSIGAVGLATPIGLGIVAGGTVLGGTAMLVKHALSKPSADPKDSWIVIECQDDSDEPAVATFESEASAREKYDVSEASTKALFAPGKKPVVTQGWQKRLWAVVESL